MRKNHSTGKFRASRLYLTTALKAALLFTLPVLAVITNFSAFALPAVESRTGQPHTRNQENRIQESRNQEFRNQAVNPSGNPYGGFHGESTISNEEPLIPASTQTSRATSNNTAAVPGGVPAGAEERAARLTLREIESLQREVSELRGIIEVQDHEIKQLKKSQQDFYLDLDRRLSQLQSNPAAKGVSVSTAASTASAAKMATTAKESAKDKEGKNKTAAGTQSEATKSGVTKSEPLKSGALKTETTKSETTKASDAAKTKAVPQSLMPNNKSSEMNSNSSELNRKSPELNSRSSEQTAKLAVKSSETNIAAIAPKNDPQMAETESQASKPQGNDENISYQSAYNLVKTKRYEEAIQAFQKYLTQFPQGEHAANAHYWLGEVYMVQWQGNKNDPALLDKAQSSFSNIAQSYPNHTKTADAVLKLGLIELDKGNQDAGKKHLMEVKSRYPGTTAARVADNRLQQLH